MSGRTSSGQCPPTGKSQRPLQDQRLLHGRAHADEAKSGRIADSHRAVEMIEKRQAQRSHRGYPRMGLWPHQAQARARPAHRAMRIDEGNRPSSGRVPAAPDVILPTQQLVRRLAPTESCLRSGSSAQHPEVTPPMHPEDSNAAGRRYASPWTAACAPSVPRDLGSPGARRSLEAATDRIR